MDSLCIFNTISVLIDESLTLLLGVAVFAYLLISTLVEWRCSDIQVSLLNNLWHITIEERHNQCVDVRTIDVGIGHDDNLVIAKFISICLKVAFSLNAKAYTDRLNDIHNRLSLEYTMTLNLLYIQNLTTEREDSLCITVTSLLS